MIKMNFTDVQENIHGIAILATDHLAGKPLPIFYCHLTDAALVVPPPISQIRGVNASAPQLNAEQARKQQDGVISPVSICLNSSALRSKNDCLLSCMLEHNIQLFQ